MQLAHAEPSLLSAVLICFAAIWEQISLRAWPTRFLSYSVLAHFSIKVMQILKKLILE